MGKRVSKRNAQIVELWNQAHPPGTPVVVTRDNGTEVQTRTRSQAELLGGHTPVVWLLGLTGCHALERVRVSDPNRGPS